MSLIKNLKWDKLGIFFSSLCLIHCAVLPIVAIFFQSLSSMLHFEEKFHEIILSFVIITAFLAFVPGYRCHKNKNVFSLAVLGIVFISLGETMAEYIKYIPNFIPSTIGSLLLMTAHFKNFKLQQAHCHHKIH